MDKSARWGLVLLLGATALCVVPARYAYADAIANEGTVLFGLAAFALAVLVILVSLITLVIIIHYLRKDRRKNAAHSGRPVPPDER